MKRTARTKRATLRDVARRAGVSVATVSRVLNGSDLVTKETRDLVDGAISALGFVPSAAARSLNSGQSRTIGALVPTLDHAIFARYLDALENKLSLSGYALVVAMTGGKQDVEEEKAENLLSLGVDGLIVSGKTHSTGFDALVDRYDAPTLITSCFDPTARYPTIGYANGPIAEMAVTYLRDLGHKHIAVVHGPIDVNDRIAERIESILATAGEVGIDLHCVSMDVAGGAVAVEAIKAAGEQPSAILCLSDVQALGALFALQRAGLDVPQDISLMGFDDLEWSAVSHPALTSIQLPAASMGAAAADALMSWIANGVVPKSTALPAEVVMRASTRRVD